MRYIFSGDLGARSPMVFRLLSQLSPEALMGFLISYGIWKLTH